MTSKVFGGGHHGPNYDVLTCLIEIMPDKELIAFAQTCRSIYQAAQFTLYIRKRYTNLKIVWSMRGEFFDIIDRSPHLVKFIHSVKLWNYNSDDYPSDSYPEERSETELCELSNFIDNLSCLTSERKEDIKTFLHGSIFEDFAFLMNVLRCPNVTKLWHETDESEFKQCWPLFAECLRKHHSIAVPDKEVPNLPQLAELTLQTANMCTMPYNAFLNSIAIPTLNTLQIRFFKIELEDDELDGDSRTLSALASITHVKFEYCRILPECLCSIFMQMPILKELRYSDFDDFEDYVYDYSDDDDSPHGSDDDSFEGSDDDIIDSRLYHIEAYVALFEGLLIVEGLEHVKVRAVSRCEYDMVIITRQQS